MTTTESLAHALGVWLPAIDGEDDLPHSVSITPRADGYLVMGTWNDKTTLHHVDGPAALVWLLTLASGETMDVGPCQDCNGSKMTRAVMVVNRATLYFGCSGQELQDIGQVPCPTCTTDGKPTVEMMTADDSSMAEAWAKSKREQGWEVTIERRDYAWGRYLLTCTEPNPGKPTGRDVRTLARLMAEAMPQWCSKCQGCGKYTNVVMGTRRSCHRCMGLGSKPGDPMARKHLAVALCGLLDRGLVLGELLALWLAGECPTCGGVGYPWRQIVDVRARPDGALDCSKCAGTGQLLGAARGKLAAAVTDAHLRISAESGGGATIFDDSELGAYDA